jgi:hypothetical protein
VFHELLGAAHVALEVAEGHLRLDHPELAGVAAVVFTQEAQCRPCTAKLNSSRGSVLLEVAMYKMPPGDFYR